MNNKMIWTTEKKKKKKKRSLRKVGNYLEKFAEVIFVVENMDEKAHYTTRQSCGLKISFSVDAYTPLHSVSVTKPTR